MTRTLALFAARPSLNALRITGARRRLLSTTALAVAGCVALGSPALARNWTDHVYDQGSVSVDTSVPNTTNLNQNSDFVKARGNGDIDQDWRVNVAQPSSASKYVLYDVKGNPTTIRGTLNANGQIFIFNKDGIVFTDTSVVNVGAIVASTGHITDSDLQSGTGRLTFHDVGTDGAIALAGTINVADAGLAAFVAPQVRNAGVINARVGKVAFAAGDTVTLDLYGDRLVEIEIGGTLADALLENTGEIHANGGIVQMTAQAAKGAVDTVINVEGLINASSVTQKGGKIILGGGDEGLVRVAGTLDTSGATGGGDIAATGQNIEITHSATLDADATQTGDGGTVFVYGDDYAVFSGTLSATGGTASGNGGNAEISGGEGVGYYGLADLSAPEGSTGFLLIDPKHLTISNARTSGILADIMSGGNSTVTINAQALANTLAFSNVNLWATETLGTGSNIDISTWNIFGSKGITANALTLAAPQVNILHDVILGTGTVHVADLPENTSVFGLGLINVPTGGILVDTLTLDGTLFTRNTVGGDIALAGSSQLHSTADTIDIVSNRARIQQGIWFAPESGTVQVGDGTFQEQLFISKDLNLTGTGYTNTTIIESPETLAFSGTSPNGANNYAIVSVSNAANVNISGFKIDGSTNTQGAFFDDNNRFIGVLYRNAGGDLSENQITNILTSGSTARSGFAVLASANNGIDRILNITDNVIDNFQQFGIAFVNKNLDGVISGNEITGNGPSAPVEQVGVLLGWKAKGTISGNLVSDMDLGIHVFDAGGNTVSGNTLSGVSTGILVEEKSHETIILENTISGHGDGSGGHGIHVLKSHDVLISGNTVLRAGGHGVFAKKANGILIESNEIEDSAQDGIFVRDIFGVPSVPEEPTLFLALSLPSYDATITDNTVRNSGDHGIQAENIQTLLIGYNDVSSSGGHGIQTRNTPEGKETLLPVLIDVIGNNVSDSAYNGIDVSYEGYGAGHSFETFIADNTISDTGFPEDPTFGTASLIQSRTEESGGDAIHVRTYLGDASYGDSRILVNVTNNTARNSADDHVDIGHFDESYGGGFFFAKTLDYEESPYIPEGLSVEINVLENNLDDSGDDGIIVSLRGDRYTYTEYFDSSENFLSLSTRIAPETVPESYRVLIDGNTVSNAGGDGIEVQSFFTDSLETYIYPDYDDEYGYEDDIFYTAFEGYGYAYGYYEYSETPFTPDLSTTISNNTVLDSGENGLFLSGPSHGDVIVAGNILTDNPVGAHFQSGLIDLTGDTNILTGGDIGLLFAPYDSGSGDMALVNDTIGTTTFTGQSTYYVELDNGAFFAPGNPTLLDGLNASYDGLRPSDTGGAVFTPAYDAIEAKIFHYVDRADLGLFDFGFPVIPPAPQNLNQEDIFRSITPFGFPSDSVSMTLLGLPTVPGGEAFALAGLSPEAGDGEMNEDELANIEPAAGGEQTSCWGDALNAAQSGQISSFTFGGTFGADSLANIALCAAGY